LPFSTDSQQSKVIGRKFDGLFVSEWRTENARSIFFAALADQLDIVLQSHETKEINWRLDALFLFETRNHRRVSRRSSHSKLDAI
jgi:hypothetical protein